MVDVKKTNSFAQFFIIFLTSFILWGFFPLFQGETNVKNSLTTIVGSNKEDLDLQKFWTVYGLIKDKYYSHSSVKKDELIDWIITWMVESLWDKHTSYMSINETKKFNEVLAWDFEWIWAVVQKVEIWIEIDMVLKWSPAKKAWIRKGDIVLKANWIELREFNLADWVDKIKGKAWTEVILSILRSWETDVLEIKVIRDRINIPTVDSKIIEEEWKRNIWYISLNMYWENTTFEFNKALNDVIESGVDGVIIDLRDNWGWYLNTAVDILSDFIANWEVLVTTKSREMFRNVAYKSLNDEVLFDKKIVVIINWNSASASEITAWALSDYKKAILVWEKSYGKWSVQEPYSLSDWSLVKVTIAKWFTPENRNIDEEWIEPDIKIEFKEEDYKNLYDRQLEEAKKILRDFIELDSLQLTIDKYNEDEEE